MAFKEAKQRMVDSFELGYLTQLLDKANGAVAPAARMAGIDRAHLYRLLKKHNLLVSPSTASRE
jgi:two-component system, NtrC family, response regulator GlrR